jgi:hypothetical protein
LNLDVYFGTNEVECGIIGGGTGDEGEQRRKQEQDTTTRKRRVTRAVCSFIQGACRVAQDIILTDLPLKVIRKAASRLGRFSKTSAQPATSASHPLNSLFERRPADLDPGSVT